MNKLFQLAVIAFGLLGLQSAAHASCKNVEDSSIIQINETSRIKLARIGVNRGLIFTSLKDVSIPETSGCWSGVTGNFDGQIVSAGVLQWNYGQNSLQSLMRAYRNSFATKRAFDDDIALRMPTLGATVFSSGCLSEPISADCKTKLLDAQSDAGKLQGPAKQEFDALFESNGMIQVQVDRFVRLLESVSDDLQRLFPNGAPSARTIKWAIDTKVQQGGFPGNADVDRARTAWKNFDGTKRNSKLNSLILWYEGLSNAPDQDGTSRVSDNARIWRQKISAGISDEQADLLQLTFLKSRTAQGQSGRWQALTFQRRAKIIFGAGCIAGECIGI